MMKKITSNWPRLALICFLVAGAQTLSATTYNFQVSNVFRPVDRTYENKSLHATPGASSWKAERERAMTSLRINKTEAVEITYDDFFWHMDTDQDRFVDIVEKPGGITMDVGDEGVTDAAWTMPDLSMFPELVTTYYYSLEVAESPYPHDYPGATHAFDVDLDLYQYLELVPDDAEYTGYLENLGYSNETDEFEVYSTLAPVPMALGLGVFEGEFGPEPCYFFGEDGCQTGEDEDGYTFTIVQTYLEVASGELEVYDQFETTLALKLRNTDSITVFNALNEPIDTVIMNSLIWYSKDGHMIRARLSPGAPWTGMTTFDHFEYQVLEAVVLPVEWLDVQAEVVKNAAVKVNWSTATEVENERFIVERSEDGERFAPIAGLDAVGNSTTREDYTFTDEAPLDGFNYYRIQQQDFNGRDTYSSIVSALVTKTATDEELVVLYPNPGRDEVYFSRPAAYELLAIDGQVLASGQAKQQLDVSNLPTGTYLVRIDGGEAYRWVKR